MDNVGCGTAWSSGGEQAEKEMGKTIQEWIDTDVVAVRDKSVRWLSQYYFFRDPIRPVYSDSSYFFAPADGIILYQRRVRSDDRIVEIKGREFSLQDAMRDTSFDQECLVVGIFMTFYDVHVNRIPYAGRLSYKALDPIDTYNYPMLAVEHGLVHDRRVQMDQAPYLYNNQRMLNRVFAPSLRQHYYILQIADFDVNSILPFELKQNWPVDQNQRFSQIRYGSQVDLIVPLSGRWRFEFTQREGMHVEAGLDTLLRITLRRDCVQTENGEGQEDD